MHSSGILCRGNVESSLTHRHCERSDVSAEALAKAEAIHLSACGDMDCFVASLLAMTELLASARVSAQTLI